MSAESRRVRQTRDPLVRYLGEGLIEAMLQIPASEVRAWATGDTRTTQADPAAEAALFAAFEHAVRAYGFADAPEWLTLPNSGLDGLTIVEAIEQGHAARVPAAAAADNPYGWVDLAALDMDGRPRVGLAGDWHGNLPWAEQALKKFANHGVRTVLHLGDFGLWPGDQDARFIRRVTDLCDAHDITILVTDGNHEDHDRLALIEAVEGVRWITDRIGYFVRGHRWEWDSTTFLSIGGAPSVDAERRSIGSSWWPQEFISDADVAAASEGNTVHVMLSHDAPMPCSPGVQRILDGPSPWTADSLICAAAGRAQITRVFEAARPLLSVHGHFHVCDRATVRVPGAHDHDTQVVSLASDQERDGNLAVLDIRPLKVTIL